MSTRLVIDRDSQLKELEENGLSKNPVIRIVAKIVSFVFHPIFIPVYIACFLVLIEPVLFAGFSPSKKILIIVRFFVLYTFFPLVSVLLCKALGFLDSIYLKTRRERIIPYMITMIYYFWMWYVIRNQPEFPSPVVILTFAIFLASIAGLMANIYIKISMHGIAIGIMIAFIFSLSMMQPSQYGLYISIALIIGGLVCTSRFILSDHSAREIYGGLFAGIASLLVAQLTKGTMY